MNFFVTGNSSIKSGVKLNLISPLNYPCGNFADKGQTVQQSYLIAKNIFNRIGKDKIDFVFIGLTADALFLDDKENLTQEFVEENFSALHEYIKLCLANNAKPVAVIFPFAPDVRETYREKFLNPLLDILAEFEKLYNLKVMNFFDLITPKEFFSDKKHLTNDGGAIMTSVFLTLKLFNDKIISIEDFSGMSYEYFYNLSYLTDKDIFNNLMAEIYSCSVKKLRRKNKLKLAFVTDHAATWCGDELYNMFAQNPRFETTVFLCRGPESTVEDILHDFEQFKAAGINVVGVFDLNEETPPQDIIFFLRPYQGALSKSFQLNNLTPQTLIAQITYGFQITPLYIVKQILDYQVIYSLAWKTFFEAEVTRKLYDKEFRTGMPRGIASGFPKLDLFYKNPETVKFNWKMTRPDAKKIIWAPHHSFDKDDIRRIRSTFPFNFQFMYEFAKAHPEISWVVKPHPRLLVTAVSTKLFPSLAAYEEYIRKWNELPNAQVYTGAYYQAIFATSDGMIHDSCSFIAEYQYTHKPMIYLLNDLREEFTEIIKKILEVSYIVDGKNLSQIAAAIQKIFVEGNDPLFDERLKVFNKYLDYYHANGMTASEFIYKNVTEELGG